jgi:hypothetical protein
MAWTMQPRLTLLLTGSMWIRWRAILPLLVVGATQVRVTQEEDRERRVDQQSFFTVCHVFLP